MLFDKVSKIGFFKSPQIVFWNHDIKTFANGVTFKVLSRDSNNIVDVVMRPKFDNSGISMRDVIISSIL